MAYAGRLRFKPAAIAFGAALLGAVGCYAYGCAIYDTSLLVPADGAVSTTGDGGGEASDDSGSCTPLHAPPRPTTEDGTKDLSFVVALHTLDFGASLDAGSQLDIGYDLDNVCTCPGPPSCRTNDTKQMHCDGMQGIDNSGGQLLNQFALLSGGTLSQTGLNNSLAQGIYGLLLRIQHYNGGMNDQQVVVAIFVSNGTPRDADGGANPPVWDGTDQWTIDSASVLGGADAGTIIPLYADTMAYVANGQLVASADFPLSLGTNGFVTLDLSGGVVTARIVPQGSSYKLTGGILAGRWPTTKMLGALSTLRLNGIGNLCPGTQAYENVKAKICSAADIPADLTVDAGSCNALSMGIQFTADPANLGPVLTRVAGPSSCADAGPDECF